MGYVGVYDPSSGFEWGSDDVAWFIRKVQEWLELKRRSDELVRRMELYEREKKRLEELAERGVISEDELAIRLREAWTRIVKEGHCPAEAGSGSTSRSVKVVRVRVDGKNEEYVIDIDDVELEKTYNVPESEAVLVLPYRVPALVVNIVKFAPVFMMIGEACYDPRCELASLDLADRGYVTDVVFPRLYEYIIGKTVLENTVPFLRLSKRWHIHFRTVHGKKYIVKTGTQAQSQKDAEQESPEVIPVVAPEKIKAVATIRVPSRFREFPDLYLLNFYRELTISQLVAIFELGHSLGSVEKHVVNDRFSLTKVLRISLAKPLLMNVVGRVVTWLNLPIFPATTFVLFQSIEDPQRGIFLDLKRCIDYPLELTSLDHVREIVLYRNAMFCLVVFRVVDADHLLLSNLFTLLNEENYTSVDPRIIKLICTTKTLGTRPRVRS